MQKIMLKNSVSHAFFCRNLTQIVFQDEQRLKHVLGLFYELKFNFTPLEISAAEFAYVDFQTIDR